MNRRHLTLMCCIVLFSLSVQAQVNVLPLVKGGQQLSINDLFTASLLNSSVNPMQIDVEIKVEDRNLRELVRYKAPNIQLSTGLSRMSSTYFLPQNTVILDSRYDLGRLGFFPIGNYNICYEIFESNTRAKISEYCQEESVLAFSPLELMAPWDKAETYSTTPTLVWKPPFPLNNQEVQYQILLSEYTKEKEPVKGFPFEVYPKIISKEVTNITQLIYPTESERLEVGKSYVWKVIAHSGDVLIGETETWVFTVTTPKKEQRLSINDKRYYILQTELDGGYRPTQNQVLNFVFDNRFNGDNLYYNDKNKANWYEIYNAGEALSTVKSGPNTIQFPDVPLHGGWNKISISFSSSTTLPVGNYYLVVRDESGSFYYHNFQKI